MIKSIVDSREFSLKATAEGYEVDGQLIDADIVRHNEQLFHALHKHQSYNLFVHKIDQAKKTVEISINGKRTTVQVRSRIDQLLKQLGMEGAMVQKLKTLKAPMPGLIHSYQVKEGDVVEKGQPLLILEAMKMENIIKSPGEGKVQKIHVDEKASVEKNELLISFT
jgi:biotin carboxyl carrier protein